LHMADAEHLSTAAEPPAEPVAAEAPPVDLPAASEEAAAANAGAALEEALAAAEATEGAAAPAAEGEPGDGGGGGGGEEVGDGGDDGGGGGGGDSGGCGEGGFGDDALSPGADLSKIEAAEAAEAAEAEAATAAAEAEAEAAAAAAAEAAAAAAAAAAAETAATAAAAAAAERAALLRSVEEEAVVARAGAATHRDLEAVLSAWLASREVDKAGDEGDAGGDEKGKALAQQLAEAEAGVKLREASAAFHRTRARAALEQARLDARAAELQASVETREAHLGDVAAAFKAYKREVSRGAVHSVTGKRIPRELLERYAAEEVEVDAALARAELKFAAASAAHKDMRDRVAAAEEMGHASSALDVDQLRVEISSLRERIDSTAEDIEKMRKKSSVAVQVITHVREKLHAVRRERETAEAELAALEGELGRARAALAAIKNEKDEVRERNEAAVRAQGFVFRKAGKTELALDFSRRQKEVLRLKEAVEGFEGGTRG
jgi:hypothetical protein